MRPVAEMVDSPNTEGVGELFCSSSCVTANKVQTVSSSGNITSCLLRFCIHNDILFLKCTQMSLLFAWKQGAPVECNSCKLRLTPQYHLAMSDGTIQNFCSFSCVVSYQVEFTDLYNSKGTSDAKFTFTWCLHINVLAVCGHNHPIMIKYIHFFFYPHKPYIVSMIKPF